MNQSIDKQIKTLAACYADCGISETIIRKMMDDGADSSGLDDRAKLIGVRLCLGMEFNREEFSAWMISPICRGTGVLVQHKVNEPGGIFVDRNRHIFLCFHSVKQPDIHTF